MWTNRNIGTLSNASSRIPLPLGVRALGRASRLAVRFRRRIREPNPSALLDLFPGTAIAFARCHRARSCPQRDFVLPYTARFFYVDAPDSIIMKAFRALTLFAGFVIAGSLSATVIDIRWNNDGFDHVNQIAAGKTIEVCGEIDPRQPVDWKFSANGALDFNIHRHSGNDVIYATRSFATKEQSGVLKPTLSHEWCWMWTNPTSDRVDMRVQLKRP